jgi:hypothetical protein
MVDTRKVADRRPLRFETLGAAVEDAEMLSEAERRGALRATGNWSLGQAIGHVAFWARAPFDGYAGIKPTPWFVRLVAWPFKGFFLNKRLPAGGSIPKVPGGTYGIEPMETDEALAQLRDAFGRLESETPLVPNLIFGKMSHADWIKLNLRHAELHFSFFHGG